MPNDFAARVAGVGALAEPVRRDLYLYVAAQRAPVSRDQAAAGVGVARHTAKFHLDRLVDEGLLDTEFKRLSGRRGPGAGRPTKLYRRSTREVSVSLPERRYDLAALLMARAIEDSVRDGTAVQDALHRAAADLGVTLAEEARDRSGRVEDGEALLAATCAALATAGYEPHAARPGAESGTGVAVGEIVLVNCPFHALSREHTALVCGMNDALLGAFAQTLGQGALTARLDPAEGRCCVVLSVG